MIFEKTWGKIRLFSTTLHYVNFFGNLACPTMNRKTFRTLSFANSGLSLKCTVLNCKAGLFFQTENFFPLRDEMHEFVFKKLFLMALLSNLPHSRLQIGLRIWIFSYSWSLPPLKFCSLTRRGRAKRLSTFRACLSSSCFGKGIAIWPGFQGGWTHFANTRC